MNDACSYGIIMNQHKAPLDDANVRWALALSLDLQDVGINALSGQFKASALPMADTQITAAGVLRAAAAVAQDLKLADGYQPFNPNFGAEMVAKLTEMGMDASTSCRSRRRGHAERSAWAGGSTTRPRPRS